MTDAEKEKIRKRYAAVGQGNALQVSDEINARFAEQTLSNKNIFERLVQKKQTLKNTRLFQKGSDGLSERRKAYRGGGSALSAVQKAVR